jgi:DNA primase
MVAELTTRRYEASKGWSAEKIHFPEEKEILHDVVYSNIIRLKYFKIHGLMDGQLQKLKQAATPEDEEEQFTIYEQLKGAEKELAAVLGIIVSK